MWRKQKELDARDIVSTFKDESVFFKYQRDTIAKRNEIYSLSKQWHDISPMSCLKYELLTL